MRTVTIAEYRKLSAKRGNQSKIGFILNQLGIKHQAEYRFHPKRKWLFDYAIPEKKIAIEYEGLFSRKSRHTTKVGYTNDAEKYNTAQIMGWVVLRYTALNLSSLREDLENVMQNR